jgi:DNA polymerase bacteriophage-type
MGTRRVVTIDFETYSELDLRKSSPWAYAEHPTTKVLCMGFRFEDEGVTGLWTPKHSKGHSHFKHDPLHIEAHNAEFERAIWELIMVPRFGFAEEVTWECTAARAAALALPRKLDDAGVALGLRTTKDKEGHALMLKMCKPKKPSEANPEKNWLHDEEKLNRLYEYCKTDVDAEVELSKAIRKLNPLEQRVWEMDQEINKRGILFDPDLVQAGMYLWEKKKAELETVLSDLTGGIITGGAQHARFLKWTQKYFPDITSVGKDPLKDLLARDDVPQDLRNLFALRGEVNKTSNAKFKTLWNRQSADGRARSMYMYHGASTGRWTGKSMQMHNLPSGRGLNFDHDLCVEIIKRKDLRLFESLYPNSMSYLSACIRQCFIPREGCIFACADYAAIEARVLLWLVGDPAVAMFRDKVDIYKDLASKIYNKSVEDITDDERQLGKQGVLGLGFRMGVERFKDTCHQYGIEIHNDMSQRVVEIYRSTYVRVTEFWDAVEETAMQCIRTKRPVRCGRVVWGLKGDFLHCSLPSGRLLSYYEPFIAPVTTPWGAVKDSVHFKGPRTEGGWGVQHSHGGVFTENIVQAIARDQLAEAMLRLETEGDMPVVLDTHDEVLCEIVETDLDKERFERCVAQPPEWGPDLPIDIDAWYGHRYRK